LLSYDPHDSLCVHSQHVAQGMCPNLVATGWAMHAVGWPAKEGVQKASPSLYSPLSNAQSRKTVCDSTFAHAGMNPPVSRVGTNLAYVHH
jgi:hypothetical protein